MPASLTMMMLLLMYSLKTVQEKLFSATAVLQSRNDES